MGLDLVVANDLCVRRWRGRVVAAPLAIPLLGLRSRSTARTVVAGSAIVGGWRCSRLRLLGLYTLAAVPGTVDEDVCYPSSFMAAFVMLRECLVLVAWLGELGDDVPRVQKARDLASWSAGNIGVGRDKVEAYVAQGAEEDVDERVGGADTALDPD